MTWGTLRALNLPSARSAPMDLPVTGLPLEEVRSLCRRLSPELRLPQEEEWCCAASAAAASATVEESAWFQDSQPRRVRQLTPSPHGLYDLLGNVYEWVADGVAKGGCFSSAAHELKPDHRLALPANARDPRVGFRLAWAGPEEA